MSVARLVLIAVFATAAMAAEREVTVRDITITGNRLVDAQSIKAALTFRLGDTVDAAAIDRAVRSVFASGQFSDVRIDTAGGHVSVVVTENPRVTRVAFEGNASLETSKILEAVVLKAGTTYTLTKARSDERAVRALYLKEGRATTTVSADASDAAGGGVAVTFKIVEGPVNKVRRVAFVGNTAIADSTLRDVVTTRQIGWFDFLKTTVTSDADRLVHDRQLLVAHYRGHGFPDVQVTEAQSTLQDDGFFVITFKIDEGDAYVFGAQTVESEVADIDTKHLQLLIGARQGTSYDASKMDASVDALNLALAKQGYPFVQVTARQHRDKARKSIAIAYVLKGVQPFHVRRVEISGNARTQDAVIRREFNIAEGDAYNAALVEAGRARLMRTGFFKSVDIKPKPVAAADQVDLGVRVEELDTGSLSLGIGYSQSDGIIGDIGYADRNFLGTGRAVSLKLTAGQRRYGAEAGFTEPHILGSDAAAGLDLYYRNIDRTLESSYKEQRWGLSPRITFPVSETVSASLTYSFSRSTIYDVGAAASVAIKEAVPGYPSTTSSTYNTSAIGYSVAYDTRDNKRNPVNGIYVSTAQDFAGLGGDAHFIRSTGEVRGYYGLAEGLVLAAKASGGTIYGYGGQDVRLLDLFYRGSETVRGFAASGLGPRDALSQNQDALGGKTYYATSMEMRQQIAPSMGLSGFGFVDAGGLFGANKTASSIAGLTGNSAAPRVSAGLGIAWDSPLGPLQASYGIALRSQAGDKVQPFNFGLGSGF